MKQRNYDEKTFDKTLCLYCEGSADSKEHVPSRIFLNKPYPENLPTVPACKKCNESYSLDEEYLACIIECARCGTIEVDKLERDKIKKILNRKTALYEKVKDSFLTKDNNLFVNIEANRVNNILIKLAQGHILYEFNQYVKDVSHINIMSFADLSISEINYFNENEECTIAPDLGCRAMDEGFYVMCSDTTANGITSWQYVGNESYRYLTYYDEGHRVKIVIAEFLACEVYFND